MTRLFQNVGIVFHHPCQQTLTSR
jgi:hypothetical protein